MNEAQFNELVDELMFSIEESIDDSGADIDYENSAGMLTITCEGNGTQIILSRQAAVGEIWLAAKSGGFHFKLKEGVWCNTVSGVPLNVRVSASNESQDGSALSSDSVAV